MADYTFVIDTYQVVHYGWCNQYCQPVTPYGSVAKDAPAMISHLARPDVANNHSAPSPLQPCRYCLAREGS